MKRQEHPEIFALTTAEANSSLWKKIYEHFQQELSYVHLELEKIQTEAETAVRRGEIRAIRKILRLNDELPEIESPLPD
jgi:hypothetical protein